MESGNTTTTESSVTPATVPSITTTATAPVATAPVGCHPASKQPAAVFAEIRKFLLFFWLAGAVAELRVVKAGKWRTISGYFDDVEKLASAVTQNDGKGPGVYITLNPVDPALLARAANRAKPYAQATTTDRDIQRRRWLLIDLDPERPSGISSTDTEHDAAIGRSHVVRDWLRRDGWPDPALIDSGNGAHLLYRIDLPNDDAATELIRGCLRALAVRHDDKQIKVDKTTFNAARISKIPGTTARKGDDTADRPHRLSRIIDLPGSSVPVPVEMLQRLADEAKGAGKTDEANGASKPNDAGAAKTESKSKGEFNIDQWIAKVGLDVVSGPTTHDGGRKWVVRCPWNPDHGDGAVFQAAGGKLGYHCFHASCSGYGWRELREKLDPRANYASGAAGTAVNLIDPRLKLNDRGLAIRFDLVRHGQYRYCAAQKRFYLWTGKYWCKDDSRHILNLLAGVIRATEEQALKAIAPLVEKPKDALRPDDLMELLRLQAILGWCAKSEGTQRLNAALEQVAALPRVPVEVAEFDADLYLLAFENGVLNLKTGALESHDPRRFITKIIRRNYRGDAECPIFKQFMRRLMGITDGASPEVIARAERMVSWLQKLLGYCMTGDVREKCVIIVYGKPDCGKSTLLNLIRLLLGDYAVIIGAETLSAKTRDNTIEENIAALRGARVAVTTEWKRGEPINEARLKSLTSGIEGAKITVCPKYQSKWDFPETHKLLIDSNFLPKASGTDDAFWNRMYPVHCPVQLKKGEIDRDLMGKLLAEGDGILRWCAEGEARRQSAGLGRPPEIDEACQQWKVDSDLVSRFIHERCRLDKEARVTVAELYPAFQNWLLSNEYDRGEVKLHDFNQHLESLGCERGSRKESERDSESKKSIKVWMGIKLVEDGGEIQGGGEQSPQGRVKECDAA
jgi:P4 family phage/plasmid primase-like protien